jgi:hypothetical protein
MGRGRAKAKQTKVARALKYGGPQTDFDRLQAELGSGGENGGGAKGDESPPLDAEYDVVEDPYADDPYAKYYDEDEDEGENAS